MQRMNSRRELIHSLRKLTQFIHSFILVNMPNINNDMLAYLPKNWLSFELKWVSKKHAHWTSLYPPDAYQIPLWICKCPSLPTQSPRHAWTMAPTPWFHSSTNPIFLFRALLNYLPSKDSPLTLQSGYKFIVHVRDHPLEKVTLHLSYSHVRRWPHVQWCLHNTIIGLTSFHHSMML